MFHKIVTVKPVENYCLEIAYQDGAVFIVDFKATIKVGGLFRSLADPRFFSMVRKGPGGRSVVWPGGLDFCADALRLEGKEVDQISTSLSENERMTKNR